MNGPAIAGFLHIRFGDGLQMVGMRAPAYEKTADVRAYWTELAGIMQSVAERPILFAGDINADPFKRADMPDARSMQYPLCEAFTVPNPAGDWSFRDKGARWIPTRIDHVLHTRHVTVSNVRYAEKHDGRVLAGLKADDPISDHAALLFDATTAG
jgi:endonuclease/exonuclease/phosphatase family metal-dependent hydrolase